MKNEQLQDRTRKGAWNQHKIVPWAQLIICENLLN